MRELSEIYHVVNDIAICFVAKTHMEAECMEFHALRYVVYGKPFAFRRIYLRILDAQQRRVASSLIFRARMYRF